MDLAGQKHIRNFDLDELRVMVDDPETSFQWVPRMRYHSNIHPAYHTHVVLGMHTDRFGVEIVFSLLFWFLSS